MEEPVFSSSLGASAQPTRGSVDTERKAREERLRAAARDKRNNDAAWQDYYAKMDKAKKSGQFSAAELLELSQRLKKQAGLGEKQPGARVETNVKQAPLSTTAKVDVLAGNPQSDVPSVKGTGYAPLTDTGTSGLSDNSKPETPIKDIEAIKAKKKSKYGPALLRGAGGLLGTLGTALANAGGTDRLGIANKLGHTIDEAFQGIADKKEFGEVDFNAMSKEAQMLLKQIGAENAPEWAKVQLLMRLIASKPTEFSRRYHG